jgi:hypothetical protein
LSDWTMGGQQFDQDHVPERVTYQNFVDRAEAL